MRVAMALLLQNPTLGELAKEFAAKAGDSVPGMALLRELVDICCQRPNLTTAQLLERLRDHEAHAHLVKLALWDLPGQDEKVTQEFLDALAQLRLKEVEGEMALLPNPVDQTAEQKTQFRALQAERNGLKDSLRRRKQ